MHPRVRSGNVIQHQIGHQPTSLSEGGEVGPVAMACLQPLMAGNSKTPITGGRQERQHMDHRREIGEPTIQQGGQAAETRGPLLKDGIGLGDQHRIPSQPALLLLGRVGNC